MEDPLGLKFDDDAGIVSDDALEVLEKLGYHYYEDDKLTIRVDENDVLTVWVGMPDGYDHLVFEAHYAEVKSLDTLLALSTVFRRGLWMDYLANLKDSMENCDYDEEVIEDDQDNFSPIEDSEVFKTDKGENENVESESGS